MASLKWTYAQLSDYLYAEKITPDQDWVGNVMVPEMRKRLMYTIRAATDHLDPRIGRLGLGNIHFCQSFLSIISFSFTDVYDPRRDLLSRPPHW